MEPGRPSLRDSLRKPEIHKNHSIRLLTRPGFAQAGRTRSGYQSAG